ncbi:hypothetical protein FACS189454_03740 [Planctomycetales bacterium]|nr:hypothetical protein FACS189454_03740 [Planctomycetales bacterium]
MLGIPCCEFMIISGGRGDSWGYSTMIAGDDDGMVSTEGTKLDGASEWTQFKVRHNEMLLSSEIFEKACRFLEKK